MKKNNWYDNGQPAPFPQSNDGWATTDNGWYDNGQPAPFPQSNDGWL